MDEWGVCWGLVERFGVVRMGGGVTSPEEDDWTGSRGGAGA